ncbi:hypothetical protein F4801DRAFT_585818 [Xylaria longipes]|nr:hypothetical protein F4801DRAFT_585818 [Xylaria longipes]RYC64020.1 hypothetical protein CHU98_g2181 [Xylaria longipes]
MSDHQWPESMRKRLREEEQDGAANARLGFTEHRNKRIQTLPLRTSPRQPRHKRWAEPLDFPPNNTITPSNSDSDPEDARTYQASATRPMDVDQDADMAIDGPLASVSLHPGSVRPGLVAPNAVGRMPTPIHCTFAAQVRGNNWGAVPPTNEGSGATMMQNGNAMASSQRYLQQDPSIPRSLDGTTEWSMVQNRRLPSPISENGGEDAPASPSMVLDNCSPVMAQLQRPILPHMAHTTNPHAMPLHPNIRMSPQPSDDAAMMDTDGGSPASAPATPSPRGKYGHTRSKHTLNNWTVQPGMKKSLSIGYRADCEKCRMKIPGHFNHIILS